MIYGNHGLGSDGLVVERTEPIVIPLKSGIKRYEFGIHQHLSNNIALGIVSFTFTEVQSTNLEYQTINELLHKNTFLTLVSHSVHEKIHSIPLEMFRMMPSGNRWFELFLPFIDISKSHIEVKIPPSVRAAITAGAKPEETEGSLEYAEANKEAFLLQFAYQKPHPKYLEMERNELHVLDKPHYYADNCR